MPTFDASGLSAAPVRTALDAGLYLTRIVKVEGTVSAKKGTPGISLQLQVLSGPMQVSGGSPSGRMLFDTLWVSESGPGREVGLSRLKQTCLAAGVTPSDNLELNDLLNKEIVVKVEHEEYNGEEQERVKSYKKP